MAKNMARLSNGIVFNIEWFSDSTAETDALINIGDRPVAIGDSYIGGVFYRGGEKILSIAERLAYAESILASLNREVSV